MPDCDRTASSAERRRSQRTEDADPYDVRYAGTKCGLFIGTDGAYAGSCHDGGYRGKCRFRFCTVVLLLVSLYLLLYYSAENILKSSKRN